jgi:hypothetical protein
LRITPAKAQRRKGAKRYRVSKGFLCALASLREKIFVAEGTFRAKPLLGQNGEETIIMSNIESAIVPGVRITSTWRLASTWIAASAVAVPLGVLVHELGHFLVYRAFGFQGAVLHFSSTTYSLEKPVWQLIARGNLAAADSLIPLWKVGTATAAGILVTCAVALICCFLAVKKSPHPLVIALGIFAPVRFLSGTRTIPALLASRPVRAGTDEAHLAALTGVPLLVLIIAGLLFLVLVWIWMFRRIPREHRWVSLGSLVSGLALGIFLYFSVIGPWLLP